MRNFEDSLAAWSSIVGTFLSILGVFQARAWATIVGLLLLGTALFAVVYARREHTSLRSSNLDIAGRRIDALNVANLTRLQNTTLVVQRALHCAHVHGQDLEMVWRYSGYCRADRESAMVFSVDAENNLPFDQLDCFAYDLKHDPGRKHRIRPRLISSDGLSKKLEVPFLASIVTSQAFSVEFHCKLPNCIKNGIQYHTASLSFEQPAVDRFELRLQFENPQPEYVRVYAHQPGQSIRLLRELRAAMTKKGVWEYRDEGSAVPGQSTRIYVFKRSVPGQPD